MNDARYICQRCGNCCRWPGFVAITQSEAEDIARFLNLTPDDFVNTHTDLLPSRAGLGLKSRTNGECVFLEGVNTCTIQSVKPRHCQGFPNTWRFPGWREVCEAIEADAQQTSVES